ncbi:MAG: hypothetical protein AB9869_35225 [Verrucomicrobiia bacterium]
MTPRLLWQEYRESFPNGYGYTQSCEYYHHWTETLDPVIRHPPVPGEKMFVDWAGQTIPMHQAGGVVAEASLFTRFLVLTDPPPKPLIRMRPEIRSLNEGADGCDRGNGHRK